MNGTALLARRNLMVDDRAVRALKRVLGVGSVSEAVRIAVRDRLALEEAQEALRRIRKRGGLEATFTRKPAARRR